MKEIEDHKGILFFLKILLFNSILLCCLFIVLELVFGHWLEDDPLKKLNIPRDEKIEFLVDHIYPSKSGTAIYTVDKYGLRGDYEDPSKIDILTIGGSTTENMLVTDSSTFQNVIANLFKKDGRDISVVSAAVSGHSTVGHIKYFEKWFPLIPDFKPKYILFYIGINDAFQLIGQDRDYMINNSKINFLDRLKNIIKNNSAIYRVFTTLRGIYQARNFDLAHQFWRPDTEQYDDKYKVFLDTYVTEGLCSDYKFYDKYLKAIEKRVSILINETKKIDAEPIIVTQSMRGKFFLKDGKVYGDPKIWRNKNISDINGVDYYYISRKINSKLVEISTKENIFYIDADNDENLMFDIHSDFYDYMHFTEQGSRKFGIYLYENLSKIIK